MIHHVGAPTNRTRSIYLAATLGVALLVAAGGCGGGSSSGNSATSQPADSSKSAKPPAPVIDLKQYDFGPGLRGDYPGVVDFLKTFLETCLANDYEGYRALVSRRAVPEPKKRFEAIYQATRFVTIDSIDEVPNANQFPQLNDVQRPVFCIVSSIEFDPEMTRGDRPPNRKVAIVVFEEEGHWRMAPAPGSLQPSKPGPTTTSSAPAEPEGPEYPWDAEGDD